MRFVATADWQLGMTAHWLAPQPRAMFQQARLDAVRRVGEIARQRGAAFVVVCGDVFESNQLDRSIVRRAFEALRSFDVPVVLVPGNHDPLDSASIYDSAVFRDGRPEHVHVLRDDAPFSVAPGVEVVGAPWASKRPLIDLVGKACASLAPAPEGTTRVIAGHGAVDSLSPDRDDPARIGVAGLLEALADGRAHFAVLGDRHSTHEVAPRIWYPGAPEVTDRREDDPGNVLVVDVDDEGARVEKVHVGQWSFTVVEERLDSAEDVARLGRRLQDIPEKARTAAWLSLTGTLSTAAHARLDAILEEAAELFAHLDRWQRHTDLAVIPDGEDFSGLALSGFAQEALDELTALAAAEDPSSATAQDALNLLYRFAGGTR